LALQIYSPGDSPIHRASPGAKLAALFTIGVLVTVLSSTPELAALCALIIALFLIARLSLRDAAHALRPVILVAAAVFALQWWLTGIGEALRAVLRIFALVLAASLVTLTTPFSRMIDTLAVAAGPLAVFGFNPARFGLAAALVIRFIPVLMNDFREIEMARAARGSRRPALGAAGPLIIKTLRMTDTLSEAILARGFETREETMRGGGRSDAAR
jgi:biotin transport system permease protein